MAIRTRHEINEDTWFVTFTCHDWLPLFELTNSYDLVYKWLKLIDDKYHIKTTGFVIMPNHVHLLLYLTNLNVNLNTIMANAKRFMAYDLVKRLADQQRGDTLGILAAACYRKRSGQMASCIRFLSPHSMRSRFIHLTFCTKSWITFIITRLRANGSYAMNLLITPTAARHFTSWLFRIHS